jgi:DTW domain-containing protein YfiP
MSVSQSTPSKASQPILESSHQQPPNKADSATAKSAPTPPCPKCLKRPELCICDRIQPLDHSIHVLILQHPQEPDQDLGTARLAHLALKNSTLKVGLSWPNLTKALGREAQPNKWVVLYLGSGIKGQSSRQAGLQYISRKGTPVLTPKGIEGIVILDGTWSQAKALWWRNAWLLKLNRAILVPSQPSLYRELRKEPRKECLSTIESIGEALVASGEPIGINEVLRSLFSQLLEKYRGSRRKARNRS